MTQTTSLTLDGLSVVIHSDVTIGQIDGGYIVTGDAIRIDHSIEATLFYRNGWNSWSPTGWHSLSAEPLRIYDNPERLLTADDAATDDPSRHMGSTVGALDVGEGRVLLLGALSLGAPRVAAEKDALVGEADDPGVQWFVAVGTEQQVFARYAELVAERFGRASGTAGTVWSSWYSYFEDIDEAKIGTAIEDLEGYPFDVVQIDDGWERIVGDWVVGNGFPSGLTALASRITRAGFRAALWVAPMICLPQSEIARTHPDWLVTDAAGEAMVAGYNWGSHYYALDTTRADVQQYLTELFEGLVEKGFTYFKLDFMYAGALEGRRSTNAHRDTVYREAIELIRRAVGPDTYLLGSGVPMLASVGVFDGARVGPDVAPYWDNTERKRDRSGPGAYNSLANSVSRVWMKRWYDVDPDVVFFRARRSLLDERGRGLLVDLAQIAGFKSTSDPVSWLDEAEQGRLRAFLADAPMVRQLGRYRFQLDERVVDFTDYVENTRDDLESMLVK
ncbi:glycoside hydrolase family 36 protein [Glaciibacter psychrotolerans]|uniref:Alpha-galactosidase n=1 Tax=Glaciibacter psychrotolerans TaxID=670054 RepID=A0A7Z0EGJ6_9MICO|nr:glycoside hydrolase family 36 protein [Leifsonia psychrotolerans]NYJ21103.1 alpha-galactosidase [Leifsonia psychrotolerans]